MRVTTGFGYSVQGGKKINKYALPIGEYLDTHVVPRDMLLNPHAAITFVEVANQAELDKIILDKSAQDIKFEEEFKKGQQRRESVIKKLKVFNLTDDEIDLLIQ